MLVVHAPAIVAVLGLLTLAATWEPRSAVAASRADRSRQPRPVTDAGDRAHERPGDRAGDRNPPDPVPATALA